MTQRGFTYIGILLAVAIMGALLAEVAVFWHKVVQREREIELLHIGDEYRRAIGEYYENSPGGAKIYPRKLEDLLQDKRFPSIRRYLRKIYVDPMTGKQEWGLIRDPSGGITGVYSLFSGTPVKQANFPVEDTAFSGRKTYSEWKFAYAASSPAAAGSASQIAVAGPAVTPQPQLPPEYAPPVAPPYNKFDPKNRQKMICDGMHANDIRICGTMLQKWGDAQGQYCLSTADARYQGCLSGTGTPPLGVRYQ